MIKSLITAAALIMGGSFAHSQIMIEKNNIELKSDLMTPEALWAMGRIGNPQASPDGKMVVYQVGYYSVKENKGHQMLFVIHADGKDKVQLTKEEKNETDAIWIEGGKKIAFLR